MQKYCPVLITCLKFHNCNIISWTSTKSVIMDCVLPWGMKGNWWNDILITHADAIFIFILGQSVVYSLSNICRSYRFFQRVSPLLNEVTDVSGVDRSAVTFGVFAWSIIYHFFNRISMRKYLAWSMMVVIMWLVLDYNGTQKMWQIGWCS